MNPISRRRSITAGVALVLLVSMTSLSGSGFAGEGPRKPDHRWSHFSSSVALRAWLADPSQAPAELRGRLEALRGDLRTAGSRRAAASTARVGATRGDRFNADDTGLPQNEESLAVCRTNSEVVLGSTNDYRGLLDESLDITGWHFSADGGASLTNEGRLPAVPIGANLIPSGGDPVSSAGDGCSLYAASLNYDPFGEFDGANGVGVYRSTPDTLASCPGGTDDSCWPTRRAVAVGAPSHFLDKEWMTVGRSGAAGEVVWATYTDFTMDETAPLGFSGASIYAVRCTADLSACTDPIKISGDDPDVQFSDVTVGADGRTYISWTEVQGELEQTAQTFVHKLRVAEPGSTTFGPPRVIYAEDKAIPFGGVLNANTFRVATSPKSDVAMVDGHPRVFATWEACSARVFDFVCEDSVVKLSWSDDLGASWHGPEVVSRSGQNYFPAISVDRTNGRLALAWFTSRYDPVFDNRQDVVTLTLRANRPERRGDARRLTHPSNETEADPFLGAFFIGDYIEVVAQGGRNYVHFNANYTRMPFLGEGLPVPQQDNYLTRARQ